ncbi:hypothetical protein BBP40_005595 [Aspergillus hancockii]|nr:hypothetical protein BBP40_005595 [Aspergillus hancockii]
MDNCLPVSLAAYLSSDVIILGRSVPDAFAGSRKPREVRKTREVRKAESRDPEVPCKNEYDWMYLAPAAAVHSFGAGRQNCGHRTWANPGFLGLTSYSGAFSEHAGLIESETSNLVPQNKALSYSATTPVDSKQLELGAQVLSLLDHLTLYEGLLEKRFVLFEGWIIGPPIVRQIIKKLRALYENGTGGPGDRKSDLIELSKLFFQNTATPVETNPTMMLSDYVSVIASRWETVSLLLAGVGTATYQISQEDDLLQQDHLPGGDKEGLRRLTMAASDLCLQFCDSLGTITDPLCWATIQHTILHSHMHGTSDYRTWKMLGDITTITFALGLHQSEVDETVPFFLAEVRKRAMAGAYILDKDIATFLGRPPRILWRYCNIQYPLDLSYDEVVAEPTIRDAIIRKLDANGWNVEGSLDKGSLPRTSLMLATIREKVLDLSLRLEVNDLGSKVQKLGEESRLMRQNLPSFLSWDPEKGDSILSSMHLEFLYQDLLLFKTLFKRTGMGDESLIKTSFEIITVLLDMVSRQGYSGKGASCLIWDLCFIGIPAAGVLSGQLLCRSQPQPSHFTSPLPGPPFPRSETIQKLSVFAAHLGSFMWRDNGNYEVCKKGQLAITEVLDRVLSDDPPSRVVEDGIVPEIDVDSMSFWDNFDWEQEIRFTFS